MENQPCRPNTLARTGSVTVQHCADCGGISLHVGPVTLRVDRRTMSDLLDALAKAREALSLPSRAVPTLRGQA